jgi:tRNA(adenine34) deaminase
VDLIGFGKSDKLKKANVYVTAWHLQVLSELLVQLNLNQVLVLEPAGDSMPGKAPTETLGQALTLLLPERVFAQESVMIDALSPQAANAPYPDPGHRAALRALTSKGQV